MGVVAMGSSGSSDPAARFVQQVVDDFGGALTQRAQRPRQGGGDGDGVRLPSFVPVSPAVAAVTVLAVEADPLGDWLLSTAGDLPATVHVVSVLDQLSGWQAVAVTATVGAVALDGLRWYGFRHRRAITNLVASTTHLSPKRVRVRHPAGITAPRRAIVSFTDGSVINDRRYGDLVDALTKYANRYRGDSLARRLLRARVWEMQVEWQAGSARLVITRHDPESQTAGMSPIVQRLTELLDEKFPLPEARITGIDRDENGTEIGFTISYKTTLSAALPGLQQKLREALVASLPRHVTEDGSWNWFVAIIPEENQLTIRLAKPLPSGVRHLPRSIDDYREMNDKQLYDIPYATAADGVLATWNIHKSSSRGHVLAAGRTGGGKTSLIRTLITEAIARGVPVAGAVDVKMLELDGFDQYPGVASVIYHVRQIVEFINAVHAEMVARREFLHRLRIPDENLPPFIVVLDEFFVMSAFLRRAAAYKGDKDDPDDEQAVLARFVKNSNPLGKIGEILALIRSLQGRIILGVQRPDATNFGEDATSVRDNFGTRISLSSLSQQGAEMMWGEAHVGRDVDASVPGRATVADAEGRPMHAQVHWTPNPDMHPNRWSRLEPPDKEIVTALREAAIAGAQLQNFVPEVREHLQKVGGLIRTPGDGPIMACFSSEMRTFLTEQREATPEPPAPIAGLDPTTAGDDGVYAADLTEGMRVHVDDDGAVATVVAVTRVGKKLVRAKLRDETNPRVTLNAEFAPDEVVLTADPGEAIDLDDTSSAA
ncbi:hypothetical protein EEB19_22445 [Gordonia sp. OPL2]|nr:hypothetical protein EEB19_22445 [Gordonia sp. OPL2]